MKIINTLTKLLSVSLIFAIPATGAWAELEEITVTARKRTETVLEIPVAVTAFSQEDITQKGILDTADLSTFTPGFDFQNLGQGGTSGRENPSIRFRGVAVQQSSPASRAGAIFWDGAYVSDGIGVLPLMDLGQAEVIKGPQNAVFGRNTFAGAVNYIPAEPGDELGGRMILSLTPDDDDSREITAVIGGPISERISGRIALTDQQKGGYYEYEDGTPLGREETSAVMGSLIFDVTDNVSVKYSGFYVDSKDNRSLVSQVGPVAAGDCNRTYSGNFRNVVTGANTGSFSTDLSTLPGASFCGSIPDWDEVPPDTPAIAQPTSLTPNVFFGAGWDFVNTAPSEISSSAGAPNEIGNTYEVVRHHLSAEIDLANGASISGFVSTGESSHWGITDANYGTAIFFGDGWWSGFLNNIEDTSAEIHYTSSSDQRLRYDIGMSYYDQESNNGSFPLFSGFDPFTRVALQLEEGTNVGVFGSLEYDINDDWKLSLEGRWNEDDQDIIYEGLSDAGVPGVVDPAAVTDRGQSYSAFMPRAIISWQPSDRDLNVYLSYSQSFLQGITTQAAGYAVAVPTAGLNPATVGFFTPRQELDAIEIGVKQAINDRFSYSAALYSMDWKNQTFFELSPGFVPLNLSGDSEYTGLELEFSGQVTDWFNLSGGIGYVDAELTNFAGAGSVANAILAGGTIVDGNQIDSTGNAPRYIPDTTASLSAAFDFGAIGTMPVGLRIDAIHTGDFYVDNFEWNQVDASTKFNVRATIGITDNINLELFGLNVTDDRTWSTAGGTTSVSGTANRKTFAVPTRGDEYGLRLIADF